jgi:hypothetical protein
MMAGEWAFRTLASRQNQACPAKNDPSPNYFSQDTEYLPEKLRKSLKIKNKFIFPESNRALRKKHPDLRKKLSPWNPSPRSTRA